MIIFEYLGEGAIMYLQMMKTFAVLFAKRSKPIKIFLMLFLVLAVINMPIYMIYTPLEKFLKVSLGYTVVLPLIMSENSGLSDNDYSSLESAKKGRVNIRPLSGPSSISLWEP